MDRMSAGFSDARSGYWHSAPLLAALKNCGTALIWLIKKNTRIKPAPRPNAARPPVADVGGAANDRLFRSELVARLRGHDRPGDAATCVHTTDLPYDIRRA